MNLPNSLSLARLLSVPITVWLILGGYAMAALALFIAAGLTDALDGYLAKRFNSRTRLGAYLDPIADKALLSGTYLALWLAASLPGWLVALVVLRDVLIVGGAVALHGAGHAFRLPPLPVSKINTVVQVLLAALILAEGPLGLPLRPLNALLVYVVAVTTVLSGLTYLYVRGRPSRRAGGE